MPIPSSWDAVTGGRNLGYVAYLLYTFFTRNSIKSIIFFLMRTGGKEIFFKKFD